MAVSYPIETLERDGLVLVYDQPRYTVFMQGFAPLRFLATALVLNSLTALMAWDALGYGPGWLGVVGYGLAACVASYRLARLRFSTTDKAQLVRQIMGQPFSMGATLLGMQWFAHAVASIWLLGTVFFAMYLLVACTVPVMMLATNAGQMAETVRQEASGLARVATPMPDLATRGETLRTETAHLAQTVVFDPASPALVAAWAKKDPTAIEAALQAMSAETRRQWQDGIDHFNRAVSLVDLARGRLKHLLAEAEAALAAHGVAPPEYPGRSGVLEGWLRHQALPEKTFLQTLHYQRGAAVAVGKAITGNGSWQMAALGLATATVLHYANRSRALRQLKELEGKLAVQATAARQDMQMLADLLQQRLLPQLDGITQAIAAIEAHLASLAEAQMHTPSPHHQAEAFALACTLREAAHLLTLKAGN